MPLSPSAKRAATSSSASSTRAGVVGGRGGEVLDGERLRRDHEQRLDRAGELRDGRRRLD